MVRVRKRVVLGALLAVLALPAAALAAKGWIAIPAAYAPKIRTTVIKPAVHAMGGGVRITSCSFQQRSRFYVCVYGTQTVPRKGAVEVERTKRCAYTVLTVDLTSAAKPKITHHASFHRCF
jgi:hypothetical protein